MTVHVEKAPLTWLVVADDVRARIFSFGDKLKPWVLSHDFTLHAKGELHDAVTHESLPSHHEPPTTPHRLGHELVHFLDKHGKAHDFNQLVFVAPPHMLGFLRGHVSSTSSSRPSWRVWPRSSATSTRPTCASTSRACSRSRELCARQRSAKASAGRAASSRRRPGRT